MYLGLRDSRTFAHNVKFFTYYIKAFRGFLCDIHIYPDKHPVFHGILQDPAVNLLLHRILCNKDIIQSKYMHEKKTCYKPQP